jgi:UPF0716 protein FxsA
MRYFFLLLPWIELFSLIELGSYIGGLEALCYVFLTMVFGVWLIRRQGEGMLQKVREEIGPQRTISPALLADELAMVFCGLLIVVPGLLTDIAGIVLMFGPLRRRLLKRRVVTETPASVTMEGDFSRLDD